MGGGIAETIVDGSWLTRARVRRVAVIAGLLSLGMLAWLFASARGTLDWLGRPLGTDFSQVWTAGRMALDGRALQRIVAQTAIGNAGKGLGQERGGLPAEHGAPPRWQPQRDASFNMRVAEPHTGTR